MLKSSFLSPSRHSRESGNPEKAYVYILTNQRNGTLYTGVTSNLIQRSWQHRNSLQSGFSNRYKVKQLVWYEVHDSITSAIQREKQLKKWYRVWKLKLIEDFNPHWNDLYETLL
jgi:putative endonuclease